VGDSNELVTLTIVANEIESEQIQELLKFENIESMQRPTNTGAGSIGGSGAMSGSREILVKPEDLEAAKAIIGEE
jgi:Putative prokaryotic signal transducing protein